MKLLLIADGRSPITRNWIKMLQPLEYTIQLISTFSCDPVPGVCKLVHLPVAFSQFAGSQAGGDSGSRRPSLVSRFRGSAARLRSLLGPLTVGSQARNLNQLVAELQPDIVHALRIPYEGMLASRMPAGVPLVVSTWGNDLTLHAASSFLMRNLTIRALLRADGLMSDVERDLHLAEDWGFAPQKPGLIVAGNGGLDLDEMLRVVAGAKPAEPPLIINPRGLRTYVRNDTFFKAIPLVLQKHPEVRFLCTSMAGQPEAMKWVETLGLQAAVTLLPMIPQEALWREFARSTLSVSVSTHDGTPNTLLEAMALCCLPVCGNLESIREWIKDGENGLLVDPADEQALANAICRGLDDKALRESAARLNREIVRQRASTAEIRARVAGFYQSLM